MKNEGLIAASDFCRYYKVENSFIHALQNYGLVEITTIEQTQFINAEKLNELEKFARLHYDLDINLEGIEVINYMIEKIKSLKEEVSNLKQRLEFYEG